MTSPRSLQVTLAQMLALNAAAAVLFAAARLGFSGLARYGRVIACVWACLLVALAVNTALDLLVGIRCPKCGRDTLRRLALHFSRVGYYLCSGCGARCKRASAFSGWQDASGPEDAGKYRRKREGRWLGFSVPEVDDSTCGRLLRSKRDRATSDPRASVVPGSEPGPPLGADPDGRAS